MKLYHIDRTNNLKCGTLLLNNKVQINADKTIETMLNHNYESYYKDGISAHGIKYYTNKIEEISFIIDIIFEYERLLHFPNNISRYQSFFAFDKKGINDFIKENHLSNYSIFEVESEYYEKHNMRLLKGQTHFIISELANDYWSNKNRYNIDIENPIYEYLLKFPVNVIKEVSLQEINKN